MSRNVRSIAAFFASVVTVVGGIGGAIVAAVSGYGVIAVCVAAAAGLAVPTIKNLWKED